MSNPDTITDKLNYLAQMMSGAGFHTDDADPILLREAAATIAALRSRLAEGEELLTQAVAIYDRQTAEIAQLQTENERLMDIILEAGIK